MGGALQLVVQTEERLDPAEAEILQRKIALAERTGSKLETADDLRAKLRYVPDMKNFKGAAVGASRLCTMRCRGQNQSIPPDDDFAEYHVIPKILQDKRPLLLLPESCREFYKRVGLPSALVNESKKVIVALYDGEPHSHAAHDTVPTSMHGAHLEM